MPKVARSVPIVRKVGNSTGYNSNRRTAAVVPPNLRRYVQKAIKKTQEKKSVTLDTQIVAFNSAITSQGDVIPLVPPIAQGYGDGDRIGDQVKGVSIDLNGHIEAAIGTNKYLLSGECRLAVRVFVLENKGVSNSSYLQGDYTAITQNLLKKGNQVGPFAGDVQSLYLPVNQEVCKVHYDKVHLITVPFQRNAATLNVTPVNTSVDLSKSIKMLKIKIPCNKMLQFNNSNSNVPVNFAPYLMIGYAFLDGTVPDVLTTSMQAQFIATLNYTDN